jgi:hypothetical protein
MAKRDISPAIAKERWILNAHGKLPGELKQHLEAARDHFVQTTLRAGVDPRDGKTPILHDGWQHFVDAMDRGIVAVLAAVGSETRAVHATLYGRLKNETEEKPGDELVVSISIAPKPGE